MESRYKQRGYTHEKGNIQKMDYTENNIKKRLHGERIYMEKK